MTFHIFGTEFCLSPKNQGCKIKTQQEQQQSEVHNTTRVPSILRSIAEDNISCGPSNPRHIVEENFPEDLMKPSHEEGKSFHPK